MPEIPTYNFTVDETITHIENEKGTHYKSIIFTNNPLFEIVDDKPIDCVRVNGELFQESPNTLYRILMKFGFDGFVVIDNQVDYPLDFCQNLKDVGFDVIFINVKD